MIVSVIVIMPVAVVVIIAIMFVFIVIVKIPVMIMVPMMVVFNWPALPGPVTHKVPVAIVVRHDPNCSCIWRLSPITLMPFVMMSHRIPIAFHPYKTRPRLRRLNVHYARWWGRSDFDSNRNLRPNR